MTHPLEIVVAVVNALVAGCESKPARAPCPPEPVLERLHDAAFHLDQGDDDARVRADLAEVRRKLHGGEAGEAWARRFVERMDAVLLGDPGVRQFEAETIRADLHDSACLTSEMHKRFHDRFPSLRPPPAEGGRP